MTPTPATLRDQGIATAEQAADPRVILTIDALIAEANASGKPWSANDIRDRVPMCNQGLVGGRVRAAALRRPVEMVQIGTTPSSLRSTHAKDLARWVGAGHAAAAADLAQTPLRQRSVRAVPHEPLRQLPADAHSRT